MMGSYAGVQYNSTLHGSGRARFVKPHVDLAPQQVQIGFDLSPKGGANFDNPLPNLDHHRAEQIAADNCMSSNNSGFPIKPTLVSHPPAATRRSPATSPRSALQQLLIPALPQPEFAAATLNSPLLAKPSLTHSTVPLLEPACKLPTVKWSAPISVPDKHENLSSRGCSGKLLQTKAMAIVSNEHEPIATSAHFNPSKGIAELVSKPQFSSLNDDERINRGSISSRVTARAIKLVVGNGERSGRMEAPAPTGGLPLINKSERTTEESRRINKELHHHEHPVIFRDKSCKIHSCMEEVTSINHPHYPHYCGRSNNVEIGAWKEGNNIERSKNTSLFMFAGTSPAAAYTKHHCLQENNDYYSGSSHNMDMDFLNSCHLCKRSLGQGQDTFMYSGDKAFCSMECRYQQIVMDERKETHAPHVIRSGASPVYPNYMPTAVAVTAAAATHHPITIDRPNFMNPTAAA